MCSVKMSDFGILTIEKISTTLLGFFFKDVKTFNFCYRYMLVARFSINLNGYPLH